MFRACPKQFWDRKRFPRIRGDVPSGASDSQAKSWFSPHTRGCSLNLVSKMKLSMVFPAYAGMFPGTKRGFQKTHSFPRIRGDVPFVINTTPQGVEFSPHTRGCSYQMTLPGGFFARFPRIRGDVPKRIRCVQLVLLFSPHTRGCSYPLFE